MSRPSPNPYAAPPTDVSSETDSNGPVSALGDWVRVARRWEVMRIVYNLLVGIAGVASVWPYRGMLLHPEVLGGVVFYGVAANICYCGGLAIESYLYLLGVRSRRVMPLLFVIGTFFAVVLTFVIGTTEGTVFLEHMPN